MFLIILHERLSRLSVVVRSQNPAAHHGCDPKELSATSVPRCALPPRQRHEIWHVDGLINFSAVRFAHKLRCHSTMTVVASKSQDKSVRSSVTVAR